MRPESNDAIFAEIAEERRIMADTLATLTTEQWDTQSLCDAWTVRDVAAHLVMPLVTPLWKFGLTMARYRGNFDRANQHITRRTRIEHGDNLPELLAAKAHSTFTPPGKGPLAPLTDILVHGQDIRRPLNLAYVIPEHKQVAVLDFLTGYSGDTPFSKPIDSVRWQATDLAWSQGDGPVVEGPAVSLMLILTGRGCALADTTGPGTEVLARQMSGQG